MKRTLLTVALGLMMLACNKSAQNINSSNVPPHLPIEMGGWLLDKESTELKEIRELLQPIQAIAGEYYLGGKDQGSSPVNVTVLTFSSAERANQVLQTYVEETKRESKELKETYPPQTNNFHIKISRSPKLKNGQTVGERVVFDSYRLYGATLKEALAAEHPIVYRTVVWSDGPRVISMSCQIPETVDMFEKRFNY
jgi:hypothetical protein